MQRVIHGSSERHWLTAALPRLADRPEWLLAALRPERVLAALARHIPEVAAGDLRLIDCETQQLFLKNSRGRWHGIYNLTVEEAGEAGQQTFKIRATLSAPNLPAPVQAQPEEQIAFGTEGWRCYIPELRLDCELEPPEQALLI